MTVSDRMYSTLYSWYVSHGKSMRIKVSDRGRADTDSFFTNFLENFGCKIRDEATDGNCFPRMLSNGVSGDSSLHSDVREKTCNYMRQHH